MVQISTVCTIQPHVSSRAMIIITDWETSNSNTCSFISTVFFIYLKLKQGFMLFLHLIHKEVIKHLAWFKTYCLGFIILFFSQVLVLVLEKNPEWPSHIAILLHVNYMMWFSYPWHSLIFSFVLVHGNILECVWVKGRYQIAQRVTLKQNRSSVWKLRVWRIFFV